MAPPRKLAPRTNGTRNAEKQEAARKLMESAPQYLAEAKRSTILELADKAVNGARMENYGDQLTNFTNIADHWTIILREKLIAPITPQEVAMMQIGLKLARLQKTGGRHQDSIVDVAGYAECLDQINNAD